MTDTDDTAQRPQTGRQIATTADGVDITRGYTGPLLVPFDSVLRNRGNYDLQLYEQVLNDEEVKATFAQRQLAVTQCEWQVDAGGDRPIDRQAADWLTAQLKAINFDNITTRMLFGVFYGYAVAEIIYKPDGKAIAIDQIRVRNRRRFRFDKDMGLRLLTQDNMSEGIPALPPYFWSFSCGADHDDEPYGLGLAHWLYWPTLFKRNGVKFWLIFLEKFGMPTAVGSYDATASDSDKTALLAAARAIQTDSGIIIPKGMQIALLEAARSGTPDYKTLYEAMNATIQKVVLGQTASTQGTAGKLGNEDLQSQVREDIIKADADLVCESFNTGPVQWLMRWNFPTAALPRVFRVTAAPEDMAQRSTRDLNVARMGFKPTLEYVNDTYGDGWEAAPAAPAVPIGAGMPGAGMPDTPSAVDGPQFAQPAAGVQALLQRHGVRFAEGAVADPPELMTQRLAKDAAPELDAWIEQIRDLAAHANSLQELRDGLLAMAPNMSLDDYAKAMTQALTAAALAGRYEVLQEASA